MYNEIPVVVKCADNYYYSSSCRSLNDFNRGRKSPNGLMGLMGLMGLEGLLGLMGLVGLMGLMGLRGLMGLMGLRLRLGLPKASLELPSLPPSLAAAIAQPPSKPRHEEMVGGRADLM